MEASSAGKPCVGEFRVRDSAPGISDHQWDEIFDVVVVGSGGGALTAALLAARGGASTVVVEKDEFFGGTTAVSGGDMWIPNNRFVKDRDSRGRRAGVHPAAV